MKFGIKIWPDNLHLIEKHKNLFDFFEIYAHPDLNLNNLSTLPKTIYTIHCAHHSHNFDPGDESKLKNSQKLIKHAINAANILNSKIIVVHPGFIEDELSENRIIDFYKNNWDSRILFENVINNYKDQGIQIGSNPESMKSLLTKFKNSLCFDFSHVIVNANINNRSKDDDIDQFFSLNPNYFHLCGIEENTKVDLHEHLFNTKYKYEFLKKIKPDQFILLETPHQDFPNKEIQIKELNYIKSLL